MHFAIAAALVAACACQSERSTTALTKLVPEAGSNSALSRILPAANDFYQPRHYRNQNPDPYDGAFLIGLCFIYFHHIGLSLQKFDPEPATTCWPCSVHAGSQRLLAPAPTSQSGNQRQPPPPSRIPHR